MEQAAGGSFRALQQVSRCAGLSQANRMSLLQGLAPVASVAERIRTGCVYDWQPKDTFGLLVTRDDPRTRWRTRQVLAPIQAHWARCAPSISLLTNHETACRARHYRKVGRYEGHTALRMNWTAFASAYRAELERRSLGDQLAIVGQILAWLRAYPSVTVLSFDVNSGKESGSCPKEVPRIVGEDSAA